MEFSSICKKNYNTSSNRGKEPVAQFGNFEVRNCVNPDDVFWFSSKILAVHRFVDALMKGC
jgi:hypothetical protein